VLCCAGQAHDWEEGSTALGHHLVDFWTNICLCQSLILEKNPAGGANLFQVGVPAHLLASQAPTA
jgi:hypothetical protein